MILIEGKKISDQIEGEIGREVQKIKSIGGKIPHLAAILVGNDGGSETYIKNKIKACEKVGYKSTLVHYENTVSEGTLLYKVKEFNQNDDIDGFIAQMPLPAHISEQKIIESIDPAKDVDGFHPINTGRMLLGLPCFVSATPAGILELLKRYNIDTKGKHCVIIGRSNIVGRPMSILMSQKGVDATVTLCHSQTSNIKEITRTADILIAAIGKAEYVVADFVKEGAVVIDVGTTRVKSGKTKSGWKLLGDVKFDEVAPICSYITPVPGGVGPMTIASLLRNTLLANKKKIYK